MDKSDLALLVAGGAAATALLACVNGNGDEKTAQLFEKRDLSMTKAVRGSSVLLSTKPKVAAPLDPGFAPYILGKRAYMAACAAEKGQNAVRTLYIAILRQNGLCNRLEFPVFSSSDSRFNDSLLYAFFTIMFALCQKGGFKILLCGPSDICTEIQKEFSMQGRASYVVDLMQQVYMGSGDLPLDGSLEVIRVARNMLPDAKEDPELVGLDTDGCRLAFDLGKSDFKVTACVGKNGKYEITYNGEHEWDIYQTNPEYHYNVVLEKMKEAAKTMPRVDSVGGASAGVPIKNDCVWNDCFPRVSREDFKRVCVPFFKNLAKEFGDAQGNPVPLKVMNDGEVTAVAGVQMMEQQQKGKTIGKGTFGISMGSNCGAGYMYPTNKDGMPVHPGWLNELWTAPVDFSPDAWECFFTAQDMVGMSSMCFGQQAACKLIEPAGLRDLIPADKLPQHQLLDLQKIMKGELGNADSIVKASKIYETVGVYLGYATAQYLEFYEFSFFLILGRLTKGAGGDIVIEMAQKVMKEEFPGSKVEYVIPTEEMKGIGQCVAAAAMPQVTKQGRSFQ